MTNSQNNKSNSVEKAPGNKLLLVVLAGIGIGGISGLMLALYQMLIHYKLLSSW